MKRNILLIYLLFLALSIGAQNATQSRDILDKVSQQFEQSKGISLDFKITTSDESGGTYTPQTGKAQIKGNMFKLSMEDMDIWFDGKTQWVLMKGVNEVNISNPTNEELATISPLALLNTYKSSYSLQNAKSATVNGSAVHEVAMTPTLKSSDIKQLTVSIDKKNNTLVQVKTSMKNGMNSIINISNYNANNNFSDLIFKFDKAKYPKAEIIDLR